MMEKRWTGTAQVLAAALLWSSAGLLIRGAACSTFWLLAVRSGAAALVLAPGLRQLRGRRIGRNGWLAIWLYAAFMFAFAMATRLTSASQAVAGQYTAPLFIYLVSVWRGRIRVRPINLLPMLCITLGCGLSLFAGTTGPLVLLPLSCGLLFPAYSAFLRRAGDLPAGAVTALNVGQGQSILVRTGRFLSLVDCGGDGYDNAGDIAADYLGDRGVGRLDLLALTHFHDDHANGVAQLLRRIDVDTLAIPDVEPDSAIRQEIVSLAQERGAEVLYIQNDTTLDLGEGRTIRLIAPLGSGETNEEGLTVLASQGEFDVLVTGDMGSDVEELLLRHTQLPELEVLAVGHHGSKYSTSQALLDQTRPEYALISVGADNRYGHPAQETVERIAAAGAEIYRTDVSGTITVQVNET